MKLALCLLLALSFSFAEENTNTNNTGISNDVYNKFKQSLEEDVEKLKKQLDSRDLESIRIALSSQSVKEMRGEYLGYGKGYAEYKYIDMTIVSVDKLERVTRVGDLTKKEWIKKYKMKPEESYFYPRLNKYVSEDEFIELYTNDKGIIYLEDCYYLDGSRNYSGAYCR